MSTTETSPREYFTLNTSAKIPALGFGTFAANREKGESMRNATLTALRAGYRHLDCAAFYQNESEIGDGIRDFLEENPRVKRAEIFVTTKVWVHMARPGDIEASLEDSLRKLKLDYVDLFLLHWPFRAGKREDGQGGFGVAQTEDGKWVIEKNLNVEPEDTWRAMESVFRSGKAKAIGVSNWSIAGLRKLLEIAKIKPACNQIEIHPFFPNEQQVAFLKDKDILPVAYSPLGTQGRTPIPGTDGNVLTNSKFIALAEKKGCTLAQLLIAWGIQRGYAVLPKSSTPGRIQSNFHRIVLSEEEVAEISGVATSKNIRYVEMKRSAAGYDPFEGVHSV